MRGGKRACWNGQCRFFLRRFSSSARQGSRASSSQNAEEAEVQERLRIAAIRWGLSDGPGDSFFGAPPPSHNASNSTNAAYTSKTVQGLRLLMLGTGDTFGEQVLGFCKPEAVEEVSPGVESRRFVTACQHQKRLALARQRHGNRPPRRLCSARKVSHLSRPAVVAPLLTS
jgi:hypothetical protein